MWVCTVSEKRHKNIPIYELIEAGKFCKLYFDIEAEMDITASDKPSPAADKKWLVRLLALIDLVLQESRVPRGATKHKTVGSDCRVSSDGRVYKRSFHVIYHEIVFPDNDDSMKDFVKSKVMSKVAGAPGFTWIADHEQQGHVVKSAVDGAVYTKNRAFRVMWSHKTGKTAMIPWDIDHWCAKTFDLIKHARDFFSRSLVGAGVKDASEAAAKYKFCFPASHRTTRLLFSPDDDDIAHLSDNPNLEPTMRRRRRRPPLAPGARASASLAARDFVKQVLPLLHRSRYAGDYEKWRNVGFAMSGVFGKTDVEGCLLWQAFSAKASLSYDEKKCKSIFKTANGPLGVETFIAWLKTDHGGPESREMIAAYRQADSEEAGAAREEDEADQLELGGSEDDEDGPQEEPAVRALRVDEYLLRGWEEDFNAEKTPLALLVKRGSRVKANEFDQAEGIEAAGELKTLCKEFEEKVCSCACVARACVCRSLFLGVRTHMLNAQVCDYLNKNDLMAVIVNESKCVYLETYNDHHGERALVMRDQKVLLER
jgi:hypothetical protein